MQPVLLYWQLKNLLNYSQNWELFGTAHLLLPATLVQMFKLLSTNSLSACSSEVSLIDSSLFLTSQQ